MLPQGIIFTQGDLPSIFFSLLSKRMESTRILMPIEKYTACSGELRLITYCWTKIQIMTPKPATAAPSTAFFRFVSSMYAAARLVPPTIPIKIKPGIRKLGKGEFESHSRGMPRPSVLIRNIPLLTLLIPKKSRIKVNTFFTILV